MQQQPPSSGPQYPQFQQPPSSGPQYPQFQQPPLQQWQPQPDYVQPQTNYPPQQYHVPPQYQSTQPPKKKPRKWPWLILVIIVLLLFAGIIVSFTARSGRNTTAPTVQATHPPIQQQGTSHPTSPSTSHTTPVSTVQPTEVPAITHGNPQLDGPISDFIGKYGQPVQSSSLSDSFWADKAQTIRVDVTPQGTIVHEILVSVTSNSSASQIKTFCEQFLPPDASAFNTTSNLIDYQSSIGEIMLQLGPGSCLLNTH